MNIKASEIIDALGGTAKLAKELNCGRSAVSNMRVRGIPNIRYQLLLFTHKKQMKLIVDHHLAVSK